MIMTMKTLSTLAVAATLLSGCSSMNVFKDDASTIPPSADLAPEEPPLVESQQRIGGVPASQISQKIAGKSWKWKAKNYSGVTLYANDGSSLIEVKNTSNPGNVVGPATTTGKWRASNGQLCESIKATPPVLMTDVKEACKPFTSTGSGFTVGSATFVLDN
jgi:hypothetical protein